MPETKPMTETKVENITIEDIDNLLGTPGAASVMTPGEKSKATDEPEKPSFFQTKQVDMSFLDDDTPPEPTEEEKAAEVARLASLSAEEKAAEAATKAAAEAAAAEAKEKTGTFDQIINEDEDLDEEGNPKPGRPKLDKAGMAQLVQTLIDDKTILPFADEDKKLEEYTMDDYKELIKMNFDNQKKTIQAETPKEFFQSLPQELQYAAKYVADGGGDLKGLFRALAASEETKTIKLDTEAGQERAVKQFLQASNFGDDTEIQEQIDSWKDLGKLEDKAQQFKPKLDAMSEQLVQRQVKEQEAMRAQREQQSQVYADSVYNVLEKGELNGLKMNAKIQNMLYSGLIQPNHQSVTGAPTNLFGHLIEKHQYVEPNHGLIAEALWLLADPDGYRSEIAKGATNTANAEVARQLKIEQQNKNAGGAEEPGTGGGKTTKPGLQRAPKNFFKR